MTTEKTTKLLIAGLLVEAHYCRSHAQHHRAKLYEEAAARLRELHEAQKANDWRPISEAPKDGTRVIGLVYPGAWPDGDHFVVQWNPILKKWIDDHSVSHPVNYFRPYHPNDLPDPPQKEGE